MTYPNATTSNESEFDWFKHNGIFLPMINDEGRNIAYKKAIDLAVPGKIVCDIGTGTGFLSILAARAGAKKVYSVEMDPGRAQFAKKIIDQVGLSDTIEIINDNFMNTDIRADIFVSETIGTHVFDENIIDISKHALRNGGRFIPESIDIWVEIYDDHPIFPLVMSNSEAADFQPAIDIDNKFQQLINDEFKKKHPPTSTIYRANTITNLFKMLPRFKDLRLEKIYTSKKLTIDFSQEIDQNNISMTVPAEIFTSNRVAVLFWSANMYNGITMPVDSTWWGHPARSVLFSNKVPGKDLEFVYDTNTADWKLFY